MNLYKNISNAKNAYIAFLFLNKKNTKKSPIHN